MTDDNENVVADPYLDKYYRMNPETEDLLFDGSELRNGMIVAYAQPEYRRDLITDPEPIELYVIQERNRWFTVSKVECVNHNLRFVATYADGHKQRMEWSADLSFYVKKDSIPTTPESKTIPVVGVYKFNPRADGTTSITITEENGTVTEFIVTPIDPVATVKSHKTFAELVDMEMPAVNPRTPFFEKTSEKTQKHDPDWAIENLQKGRTAPPKWLNEDPNPTRTDIPVFKEPVIRDITIVPESLGLPYTEIHVVQPDPTEGSQDEAGMDVPGCTVSSPDLLNKGITHRCVKEAGHETLGDLDHENGSGMTWRERKPYEIQDIQGCQFTWRVYGSVNVYHCSKPVHEGDPLHDDGLGNQYMA